MKRRNIIISSVVIGIASVVAFYFYLAQPVEVVLKDLDSSCNFDGRHYTIVKVVDGRESLLNKLVLIDGREFDLFTQNPDTAREIRVTGKYSLFEHKEQWAGCTGAHSFKIEKILSVKVAP